MRQILSIPLGVITPVLSLPRVNEWLRFADQHFTVISTGVTLFVAVTMWVNL